MLTDSSTAIGSTAIGRIVENSSTIAGWGTNCLSKAV